MAAQRLKNLPPMSELSEQQVRGTACVYCGVCLDNGTAVDLGQQRAGRADRVQWWFPRACRVPHP